MGRGGEQREWLAVMKDLPQTVLAFAPADRFGRPRREPLLQDFHMVGGGYDSRDPWQDIFIPKKTDGKRPVGAGTKLTYRYYVQDMAYACALAVPEAMEEEVAAGLEAPVWPICLGRRNCIPTDMVFRGFFDNEEKALTRARTVAEEKKRLAVLKVIGGKHDEGEVMILNDVPVNFGLYKRYEDRTVTVVDLMQE